MGHVQELVKKVLWNQPYSHLGNIASKTKLYIVQFCIQSSHMYKYIYIYLTIYLSNYIYRWDTESCFHLFSLLHSLCLFHCPALPRREQMSVVNRPADPTELGELFNSVENEMRPSCRKSVKMAIHALNVERLWSQVGLGEGIWGEWNFHAFPRTCYCYSLGSMAVLHTSYKRTSEKHGIPPQIDIS